ncbi:DUF2093 domain-containing protein [Pseudochrobactrum sp. MP213Fo]|uniref:DUF2093 domain-containing protein n=1 Tax=Pseudochrobactrum sp. MP213Fo TaxID=3022250 RepID=UPI003B9E3FE2
MTMFASNRSGEAKLRYLDGDYEVVAAGSYVLCAVTSEKIELDDLRYWSVARQEAYANGLISYQRELERNPELRQRSKG